MVIEARESSRVTWGNILPVVQITVCLGSLGAEVGEMAGEEEVVLGCNGKGVAHESSGIDDKSTSHGAGNTKKQAISTLLPIQTELEKSEILSSLCHPNVHLSVLLGIHHSSDGDTEVGDGAPEV